MESVKQWGLDYFNYLSTKLPSHGIELKPFFKGHIETHKGFYQRLPLMRRAERYGSTIRTFCRKTLGTSPVHPFLRDMSKQQLFFFVPLHVTNQEWVSMFTFTVPEVICPPTLAGMCTFFTRAMRQTPENRTQYEAFRMVLHNLDESTITEAFKKGMQQATQTHSSITVKNTSMSTGDETESEHESSSDEDTKEEDQPSLITGIPSPVSSQTSWSPTEHAIQSFLLEPDRVQDPDPDPIDPEPVVVLPPPPILPAVPPPPILPAVPSTEWTLLVNTIVQLQKDIQVLQTQAQSSSHKRKQASPPPVKHSKWKQIAFGQTQA
jgi:hypothetical protein